MGHRKRRAASSAPFNEHFRLVTGENCSIP
jgi:hypothetical protein